MSGQDFDCLDHLNPALRDFYASGNNLSAGTESNRTKYLPETDNKSSFFSEEKFKILNKELRGADPIYADQCDDDYYPNECNYLAENRAIQGNLYDPPTDPIDEELVRQQLLLLSTRADEELMRDIYHHPEVGARRFDRFSKRAPAQLDENLLLEHLAGFGEKREAPQEDQNRKRRLCRHFLKGHCKRGKACDFLHDSSIFCPDLQKVFLGGLPAHITESSLREKLAEQGFTVINRPKVLRGFTPQVCLGSVNEAQRLIEKGKINIDGSLVDVRPYEAFAKDNLEKKLPDDIKRSVFLGGLVTGTTGQRIKDDLEKMDVRVVNHPIIKTGFSPMVTLGTVQQAQLLVKLKKVLINDALVDVRPYVDFRKRY